MDGIFDEEIKSLEIPLEKQEKITIKEQLNEIILYGQKHGIELNEKILENEGIMISITMPDELEMVEQLKRLSRLQVNKNTIKKIIAENKGDNKIVIHFILRKEELKDSIENFLESFKLFTNKGIIMSDISTTHKELVTNLMIRNINALKVKGIINHKIDEEKLEIKIEGCEDIEIPIDKAVEVLNNMIQDTKISTVFSNIGIPIDVSKYVESEEDMKNLANAYGEGRVALENLLYFCIKNKIKTLASCAGHKVAEKTSPAYLTFILDDKNTMNAIKYMKKEINEESIEIVYENKLGCDNNIRGVTMCVNYNEADKVFIQMQQILEEFVNNQSKKDQINSNRMERIKAFCFHAKSRISEIAKCGHQLLNNKIEKETKIEKEYGGE